MILHERVCFGVLICHGILQKASVYAGWRKFMTAKGCGINLKKYANFYANQIGKYALI